MSFAKAKAELVIAVLAVIFVISGCSEQGNILKNPGFEKWNGVPEGWSLEGAGAVKKMTGGAGLSSGGPDTPFLYQQLPLKKRLAGKHITFAGWVRSDVPGAAFLEYSDRKGTDIRSLPHPGDGEWHYLKLNARVGGTPGVAEFRFRNYGQGTNFIKEPVVSFGAVSADSAPGAAASTALKWTVFAALGMVFIAVLFAGKKGREIHKRLFRAFLAFILLSSMSLILSRNIDAAAASTAALVCLAAFFAAIAVKVFRDKRGAVPVFLRRIDVLIISVSILFAALAVNSIRNGAVREAERNARWAYALFVTGGAVITVSKLVPRKSKGVEEIEMLRAEALKQGTARTEPAAIRGFAKSVLETPGVPVKTGAGLEENG